MTWLNRVQHALEVCGVAQMIVRRSAVYQAQVRFPFTSIPLSPHQEGYLYTDAIKNT